MAQSAPALGKMRRSEAAELIGRWAGYVALATAVGVAYFLVGQFTMLGAVFEDKSTLFWPAAGISSGLLIVLGPRSRWPAFAGILVAEAAASQVDWNNPWLTVAMAVWDPVEALTVSGLVLHYFGDFGAGFALDRTRNVLGLLGAAVVGAAAPSLAATVAKRFFLGPSIGVASWERWFAGDVVGIVAVAPLVIGLADALRHTPPRREYVEGTLALLSLAMVTSVIVSLPRQVWEILLPIAWPFPILLWLAGRSGPTFTAAGAFLVSGIIVWTATFGIGHFGDASRPLGDRTLEAQVAILFLAVSAYVLATLFAERRQSEAVLAHANAMLERERNNKLMNAEATAAAIAHELKQPLAAMVANADASLGFLEQIPPNVAGAKAAMDDIVAGGHRTGEALDGVRTLFRNANERREPVDMNGICRDVLRSMRNELNDHGITLQSKFTPEKSLVRGSRGQLQQVMFNLVHNAVEAMATTTDPSRVLRLITQRDDRNRIVVAVQDTGPGIDPKRLGTIFDAFVTTKP